jgi:hypothetical protein
LVSGFDSPYKWPEKYNWLQTPSTQRCMTAPAEPSASDFDRVDDPLNSLSSDEGTPTFEDLDTSGTHDAKSPGSLGAALDRCARGLSKRAQTECLTKVIYTDPRVVRMFRSIAFAGHLQDQIDEARQRVAMLFLERFTTSMLERREPEEAYYKVIYALIYNVFRSIRKEQRVARQREHCIDDDNNDSTAGSHGLTALGEHALIDQGESLIASERRIDMERAQKELARRLKQAQAVGLSDAASDIRFAPGTSYGGIVRVPVIKKKPRSLVPSSKYGPELQKIRERLRLRNDEFADALGISQSTLASYLYERVQTIPDRVLSAARDLLANSSQGQAENDALAEETMQSIIARWIKLLNVADVDASAQNKRIGEVLGINSITIWRWRSRDQRPRDTDLTKYNKLVIAAGSVRTKAA